MSFTAAIFAAAVVASATPVPSPTIEKPAAIRAPLAALPIEHKVYGFVQSLSGNTLIIRNRFGKAIAVDGHAAYSVVRFYAGRPVIVFGTTDANGVMHATAVWRTYPDAAHWPVDQ